MKLVPTETVPAIKQCYDCKETKPVTEFYRNKSRPDGYKAQCKVCNTMTQRLRYQNNPKAISKIRRKSWLKTQFGVTWEEYERLFELQGGKCAICKGPPDSQWGRFMIDHCHTTNRIRGLLCGSCNRGLGQFKDHLPNMRAAVRYLEDFYYPS